MMQYFQVRDYSLSQLAQDTRISESNLIRWLHPINRKDQAILYGHAAPERPSWPNTSPATWSEDATDLWSWFSSIRLILTEISSRESGPRLAWTAL